jgi:hypothetical protein
VPAGKDNGSENVGALLGANMGECASGSTQYKGNDYLTKCGCGCPVLTAHAQAPALVLCHVHCPASYAST